MDFNCFSKILPVFSNHFLPYTANILNPFTMYGCKTPQLADQAGFGTHTCLGPAMKSILVCNKDFWIQNDFIFDIDAFLSLTELWAELVPNFLFALLNASMFSWSVQFIFTWSFWAFSTKSWFLVTCEWCEIFASNSG